MKNVLLGIAGALALAPALASEASAAPPRERVVWLMPEFVLGEVPGLGRQHRGLAEPALDYLLSQWPEVQHEIVNANVKRSWQMLDAGAHACYLMTLRTPQREPRAYFSSVMLLPPLQLILRKDKADQVPRAASGEVDLHRLLDSPALRGALVTDRSYGPGINEELAKEHTGQHLALYPPGDFGGRVLQMLARGLADYSIEYEITLSQQRRNAMPGQIELISLPIQGANSPLQSGIACPRNAWGEHTVERINQIFATPAGQVALKRNYERWLTPETRARYGTSFDAQYNDWMKSAH